MVSGSIVSEVNVNWPCFSSVPGELSQTIGGQLVPDLDLVAIGILKEYVGLSRHELSAARDPPARVFDCPGCFVDVAWVSETKTEVFDSAGFADAIPARLQYQNVLRARRLCLDEVRPTVDSQHAEHVVIELKRAVEITHRQREVSEAEGLDHASPRLACFRRQAEFTRCKFFRCERAASWTPMTPERLNAFSDGVIVIIITIMVLELNVPHGTDLAALSTVFPEFLVYVLSFVIVGIYWNNHHHLLYLTRRITGGILWANLHLLFWLSLMPFVTGWMGENHFAPLPTALYGAVLLLAGIAYYILEQVIIRNQDVDSPLVVAVGGDTKGKISIVLYASAIPLAFMNQWISDGIYALVAMVWLIPDSRIEALFDGSPETTAR